MKSNNSKNNTSAKVTAISLCSVILAAAVGMGIWKVILPKTAVQTDTAAVNGVISQNVQTVSSDTDTNTDMFVPQVSSFSETSHTAKKKKKTVSSETSSKKTPSAVSSDKKKESSKASYPQSSSAVSSASSTTVTYTEYYFDPHPVDTVSEYTDNNYVEPIEPDSDDPIVVPEVEYYEEFDEYGRLYIDTDTLDGKKAAAITFDDGPSDYTPRLLDGLKARNVHATFFIVGSRAELYPDVVRRVADEGHQLGNHTYSHPVMTNLYEYSWRNEIAVTDRIIEDICGKTPTAFRPPYGSFYSYMAATIDKTFTVWSLDTLDWQTRNAYSVQNAIINQCSDGKIILLHDLYKTSVDGALAAIDVLQSEGYVFVTVDELLTRYGYPIANRAYYSQYPVSQTVFREKPVEDTDSETDTLTDTDTDTQTDTDTITDTEENTDTEPDTEETDTVLDTEDTENTDDTETQDSEDSADDDTHNSEYTVHFARMSYYIQTKVLKNS